MRFFTLIFFIFLSLPNMGKTYEVNTQHSFVNFELDYMKVSTVKGAFEEFNGVFDWDEERNILKDVEFAIKANSINTRDSKRDNHLRRKDFFYVEKYPLITFKSTNIISKNNEPIKVKGFVTIKDVKKEMTFEVDWKGLHRDPVDKKKRSLFLEVEGTINRQDFDITWNKELDQGGWVVGDKIDFEIVIEANPTDSRAAFSRFYMKKSDVLPGTTDKEAVFGTQEDAPSEISEKKSPKIEIDEDSRASENGKPQVGKSLVDFILGFILFLALCVGGFFLKKKSLSYLEKRLGETKAELVSDFILYALLFVFAILLAPYMGYSKYFN